MRTLFFAFLILFTTSLHAQIEFGVKTGLSSIDLADKSIILGDENNTEITVADAGYGIHFGLYSRVSLLNLYIEPALLFNSSTVDYNLKEEVFDEGVINTIRSESYNKLDIPVMVGMKMGFFRFHGGPVAHLHLNSASELTAINGYAQKFKEATYGFQAGVGLDILKLRIDVNYESNLSKFGDHINVGGQDFSFDDRPARLVASLGFRF